MSSYKGKRIETEITRYVNSIILKDIKDNVIKSITITDTELNKDLSLAKIYFTSILELEKEEMEKIVNESASFIRSKLANLIKLRHIPELKFVYDASVEYGDNIEKLLRKITK